MPELSTRRGSVQAPAEALTFEASLSSELPVERMFGAEVLEHSASAIDLSRAKDGLPLLINHDQNQLVGRVDEIKLQGRKLRGTLRFFNTAAGMDARQLLQGGHREVSIGYHILEYVNDRQGDTEVMRVSRWLLLEASIVAVPADASIGVQRSAAHPISRGTNTMDIDTNDTHNDTNSSSRSQRRAKQNSHQDELLRRDEITAYGKRGAATGITIEDVERAIANGDSAEDFREFVFDRMSSKSTSSRSLRLADPHDLRTQGSSAHPDYSLQRVLRAQVDPLRYRGAAEMEIETSSAMQARSELKHDGIVVPIAALFGAQQRALSVGVAGSGGVLVGTNTDQGPPIDVLRSQVVVARLGARFLTGLVGNMQFPRKTSASTVGWTTETGAAASTGPGTDMISLTPKRVTAYVDFSKQLLIQTGGGTEQMILDDLRATVATVIDQVALRGSGSSNEPRGIANTSGVGSVIGGTNGAQIIWSHIVGLESAVANADACDPSVAGYVVNTKSRGWLKSQVKATNLQPIWPEVPMGADGLERLNGYRAGVTNLLRSNLTKGTATGICSELIFGSFNDLLVGIWGDGFDVTVDPYTLATTGQVRVTINVWMDVAVRRASSFSVMADALTA